MWQEGLEMQRLSWVSCGTVEDHREGDHVTMGAGTGCRGHEPRPTGSHQKLERVRGHILLGPAHSMPCVAQRPDPRPRASELRDNRFFCCLRPR